MEPTSNKSKLNLVKRRKKKKYYNINICTQIVIAVKSRMTLKKRLKATYRKSVSE